MNCFNSLEQKKDDMKALNLYRLLLIPFVAFWLPLNLHGQGSFSRSVEVSKEFKVNMDCNVEISNKYGNIHFIPWAKDSVLIDIHLAARAPSLEKLDKMLAMIDFEFTSTKNYVVANTYFKDYANRIINDINKIAGSLFGSGTSVEINYTIHLPSTSHLKIENKFGNVFTTNHEGSILLNLSNGDFKANDLKGDSRISISFGNGNIRSVSKGSLTINYCEFFDLQTGGDLNLDSRSSKISIGEVRSLNMVSRRDKISIQEAGNIDGNSSFSYINVYAFSGNANIEAKYGSLTIQGINRQFKYIGVISSYTDVNLYFSSGSEYNVELRHDKKTMLSLPSAFNAFKKENINPQEGIVLISGKTSETASSRLRIESKAGSVTIIQK
jgi:hypothetical protein